MITFKFKSDEYVVDNSINQEYIEELKKAVEKAKEELEIKNGR